MPVCTQPLSPGHSAQCGCKPSEADGRSTPSVPLLRVQNHEPVLLLFELEPSVIAAGQGLRG